MISPVSNQNQSKVPVVAGAVIGAAAGGEIVERGIPKLAKSFNLAKDTYVASATDKAFDRLVDGGITKEKQIAKALAKVAEKATQDFKGMHKIASTVLDFTKAHKNATLAIGITTTAIIGGLIGKAISNKGNKE